MESDRSHMDSYNNLLANVYTAFYFELSQTELQFIS